MFKPFLYIQHSALSNFISQPFFLNNFEHIVGIEIKPKIASLFFNYFKSQLQVVQRTFYLNCIFYSQSLNKMNTQKLLERVGDEGRFQIYSIVFVSAKWLFISLMVFLPSYFFMTPTFTCGSTTHLKEVDACPIIETCTIDQIYTITSHAKLYCDDLYIRNSIISAEFVGSVTGLILLSILADKLGRKVIIVATLSLALLGTCILTIATYYVIIPLMYVGMILMGFGGYSLSMVSYSYLSEISSDIWRQRSLVLTYSFWALGEIALYPIIVYMQNWIYICFFIFVLPLTSLLAMSYFIVEPPEFLFHQNKRQETLENLNYIARFNNKEELTSLEGIVQSTEEAIEIKDTFLKAKYVIPLVILSFAQICNNGFYYTIQYSVDDYGYRFETNMLVIGCLQFGSCFFTNFFCHKMKRKFWIIVLMILSGTLGICVQFTDSKVGDLLFIGASRLFNTVAFALFSLISAETFPTSIRSTGLGISEAMSNLGNMAAPFLVTLAAFSKRKAVFIGGFFNLAGGISMLIVKQTKVSKKQKDNSLLQQSLSKQV